MLYVSPKDITAHTADGIHCFSMEADVPTELPDLFVPSLVALGARPTLGEVVAPAVDNTRVAAIALTLRDILSRNDPETLTREGTVKVAVLDAELGFATTKAERDAASAVVEG